MKGGPFISEEESAGRSVLDSSGPTGPLSGVEGSGVGIGGGGIDGDGEALPLPLPFPLPPPLPLPAPPRLLLPSGADADSGEALDVFEAFVDFFDGAAVGFFEAGTS